MNKNTRGMGSGGDCICPKCGKREAHRSGSPCREGKCSDCGRRLVREDSYHHQLFETRKEKNLNKKTES